VISSDNKDGSPDLEFNKLNFNRWYNGVFSAYTIATSHNIIELFSLIMKTNPFYLLLIIPIFFIWIFFAMSFLIGMINHYYVRVIKASIKDMKHYQKFKRVFQYFSNEDGIVDYTLLEEFIAQFISDPESIEFGKYENYKVKVIEEENRNKKEIRSMYCCIIRQHSTPCRVQEHQQHNGLQNQHAGDRHVVVRLPHHDPQLQSV
jgi:hypothetical protein